MKAPRLREWREARGLTQIELGQRAGVSDHSISRIETGATLRPSTARRLSKALGIEVTDLLESPPVPLVEAPSRRPFEETPGAGPEEDDYEAPDLTEEEVSRLARAVGEDIKYPEAAEAIWHLTEVCEMVEYSMERGDYGLREARHSFGSVLSALALCRSLRRGLFKDTTKSTPRQREALDQLENRLKEARAKTRDAFQMLWDAEEEPNNVVPLKELRELWEWDQRIPA